MSKKQTRQKKVGTTSFCARDVVMQKKLHIIRFDGTPECIEAIRRRLDGPECADFDSSMTVTTTYKEADIDVLDAKSDYRGRCVWTNSVVNIKASNERFFNMNIDVTATAGFIEGEEEGRDYLIFTEDNIKAMDADEIEFDYGIVVD